VARPLAAGLRALGALAGKDRTGAPSSRPVGAGTLRSPPSRSDGPIFLGADEPLLSQASVNSSDLAIVLASALLHAGWSMAIKSSRDSLVFNMLQAVVTALVGVGLLLVVDLTTLPTGFWQILAATGVAHALYFYWLSRALAEGDISLVYPIARSTPAFLPLIAVPLFGESISVAGGLGIAIVVAGIWLMNLQRGFTWRGLGEPGLVFAYLTLLTTVAYSLTDARAMVLLDSAAWTSVIPRPIFYLFMLHLASTFLFVPLVLMRKSPATIANVARNEWRKIAFAIVIGIAGYSLILQALRTSPASYVVAVRQSSVFFVLALGFIGLGERPSGPRLLGATFTVAGVALIAVSR
jgi:drug/metabolite transporter (DMT)-like permease